jgi:hypothetical protein
MAEKDARYHDIADVKAVCAYAGTVVMQDQG